MAGSRAVDLLIDLSLLLYYSLHYMNSLQSYSLPVSEKGQVTIPIDIRRLLCVASTNRVVAVVSGQKVLLKRPGLSLKEVYGSIKPIKKSFSEMRSIAKQERLREYKQ